MTGENWTCETDLEIGDSSTARLRYTMLQTLCEADGARRVPVYGIRAEMFTQGGLADSAVVADITTDEKECRRILELLAKNTVTPVTLREVLEDLLAAAASPPAMGDCSQSSLFA